MRNMALTLAAAAALAACGDAADRTAMGDGGTRRATQEARQEAREATASVRASPRNATPSSDTSAMGAAPAPAGKAADAQITARINAAIARDRELRGLKIDVDTQDGVVTLSGSVPTAAARARAGEVAHSTKDVRSVNDQLTLAGN